jgi:hypothetical protein
MVLSFGRCAHRIHPQTNITGETPYMKIVTIANSSVSVMLMRSLFSEWPIVGRLLCSDSHPPQIHCLRLMKL